MMSARLHEFLGGGVRYVWPIVEIQLKGPGERQSEVTLPEFVNSHSGTLTHVEWQVKLPEQTNDLQVPALLLPQLVQGARFTMAGRVIYDVPASDKETARTWYRTVLVPLPQDLLMAGHREVTVAQTGHLRGWYLAPLLAGELGHLRPFEQLYLLLGHTLPYAVNILCVVGGLLLMAVGYKAKNQFSVEGGLTLLLWGLLFAMVQKDEVPASWWFFWRGLIFAMTGHLIFHLVRFKFRMLDDNLPLIIDRGFLLLCNAGWILYFLLGTTAEATIDNYWSILVIFCYSLMVLVLLRRGFLRGQYKQALLVFFIWILLTPLGLHEYRLLTEPQDWLRPWMGSSTLASALYLQPIYVCQLALPVLVAMAIWMPMNEHLQRIEANSELVHQMLSQRQRLIADIHDGVGSRLNLLLWKLRSTSPKQPDLDRELTRCVDELRFAINPKEANPLHLQNALQELCEMIDQEKSGVSVTFVHNGNFQAMSSENGLHLYKAAQECFTNALRHSGANQVSLQLLGRGSTIELVIQDNGNGIPTWDNKKQMQRENKSMSLGLHALKFRLAQLGGNVTIDSGSNGTKVTIVVPCFGRESL